MTRVLQTAPIFEMQVLCKNELKQFYSPEIFLGPQKMGKFAIF
jgi:hypothetical protein